MIQRLEYNKYFWKYCVIFLRTYYDTTHNERARFLEKIVSQGYHAIPYPWLTFFQEENCNKERFSEQISYTSRIRESLCLLNILHWHSWRHIIYSWMEAKVCHHSYQQFGKEILPLPTRNDYSSLVHGLYRQMWIQTEWFTLNNRPEFWQFLI